MFNVFYNQNYIELNPPIQEDEFVFKYEEENFSLYPFFDHNKPPQNFSSFFNRNNQEEESNKIKCILEINKNLEKNIKGKEIQAEISTNITNKKNFTNEHKIKIVNFINEKTDEKYSLLNEETIKNNNKNISLGEKRKKLNEEKAIIKSQKKNSGRKRKDSTEKGIHTKYNEDNMIIKIKIFIFNNILNLLNHSFIYIIPKFTATQKNIIENKFFKINPEITHSIKIKTNKSLLDMKIKNILDNKISPKYSTIDKNHNKVLIQKIYEEKKEKNIIHILELTFRELLNVFRGTISAELQKKINENDNIKKKFLNMEIFIEKIKNQEIDRKDNDEFLMDYIDELKKLCMNFEKCFSDKKGRK